MPVYEYACTNCDEQLEVRQSFTDETLTVCPECSGRLRKVLSAVGVVFKGSGFYRNDSRASTVGNGSNGDGGSGEDGGSTGGKDGKDRKAESTPGKGETSKASKSETGSGSRSDSAGGRPSGRSSKTSSTVEAASS